MNRDFDTVINEIFGDNEQNKKYSRRIQSDFTLKVPSLKDYTMEELINEIELRKKSELEKEQVTKIKDCYDELIKLANSFGYSIKLNGFAMPYLPFFVFDSEKRTINIKTEQITM